jgi:Universal stress protein UspA and related nucleotide-binding proteins
METLNASSIQPALGVRATRTAPIIVATDGRAQSDAAFVMGRVLSGSDAIRLVTVVRPVPILPDTSGPVNAEIVTSRRAEAKHAALRQAERLWQDEGDVEVYDGDPAYVLGKLAHAASATLIVVGLGRHRVADRLFGNETALRLIRVADRPVLAVANDANRAPRRIVVAVDFSETSLRAARLALDLAAPDTVLYLVHVATRDSSLYDWAEGGVSYKQDAGDALEKVRDQLHAPGGIGIQKVLLQGDPATELLAFAASVNADLIATGSHGRGFVTRMLIGSVTTRLMRLSTCSVLTVPHNAVMTRARVSVEPPSVVGLPHAEWAAELETFSRRNAGRHGTLEVDDPDIGAQAQEFDYPLMGAAFDVQDQRVQLMFGAPGNGTYHLTRSIGAVTSIDVLRDERGRDLAIRIAHGNGQTLLTFST